VALGALLLYLVSPIDLVPDFLPVIGSIDDLIVSGFRAREVRLGDSRAGVTQLAECLLPKHRLGPEG
jgi:uncharacterized membrane protein YkvA (DUF1232 family)